MFCRISCSSAKLGMTACNPIKTGGFLPCDECIPISQFMEGTFIGAPRKALWMPLCCSIHSVETNIYFQVLKFYLEGLTVFVSFGSSGSDTGRSVDGQLPVLAFSIGESSENGGSPVCMVTIYFPVLKLTFF